MNLDWNNQTRMAAAKEVLTKLKHNATNEDTGEIFATLFNLMSLN